jgi:hypothetical protein
MGIKMNAIAEETIQEDITVYRSSSLDAHCLLNRVLYKNNILEVCIPRSSFSWRC